LSEIKFPTTFNNNAEYNRYANLIVNKLSKTGKKMFYFYQQILFKNIFLNNTEKHSFKELDDPNFKEFFLEEKDEYFYVLKYGQEDIVDNNFNYRLNNYSFRSDHFTKLNNDDYSILVNGCSVTFGMALPEKHIWPTLLTKEIKTNKKKNLYNISVCGIDTFQLINNFYTFINLFGIPNIYFMIVPPIYRFTHMYNKNERINTYQNVAWLPDKNAIEDCMINNENKYMIDIFYNISAIRNLETFCKHLNIRFFWFSWDTASQEYYESFEFDNLIRGTNNKFTNIKNDDGLKYWDVARDNSHNGLFDHARYAKIFYEEGLKNENWYKNKD